MKFQIKWLAKKVLKERVYEDYGQIMTEISKIKDTYEEDVRFEIIKIIRKYFPEIIDEYKVIVDYSKNPHFDYVIRMRKKERLNPSC